VGDEAAKVELPMVVHATSLESARIAVEAGAKLLVHSVQDRRVDDEFIDALVEQETFYCPTLTVSAGYHQLRSAKLTPEVRVQLESVHPSVRERALATEALSPRMSGRAVEGNLRRLAMQTDTMNENMLRIHEAGVPVVMGTDAGNPLTLHGPSVYPEMEAMQEAGMTASEVLVASTKHAARAMGRGDDLGVIAVGRIADMIVLEDDPSEDITNMRTLLLICRAGIIHQRDDLLAW
jgi:imidazolonepropionase-like amidohydrolase